MTGRAVGRFISGAAVFALASSLTVSARQDATVASTETKAPLVVKVGVDLIQIDATVTDKDGQPVRDLRAEDFTVEIDGKKQPVSNAMFFEGRPSGAVTGVEASPAAASPDRTLVFIVDDLNASFGSMYTAKRAMQKFAAGWDFREARVGLRSTSDDGSTVLLSRSPERFDTAISKVRYNIRSDKGASSEPDFLRQTAGELGVANVNTVQARSDIVYNFGGISMGNPALARANYEQRVFCLLSTINALRSVPGRKGVVLVSEGFGFGRDRDNLGVDSPFDSLFAEPEGVDSVLRMITEVANRASVVIYTIDPSGLLSGTPGADTAFSPSVAARQAAWSSRVGAQWTLTRLSEDTGGLSVYNRNDLAGGLTQLVNDQRAYYLLGFEPPKAAFEKASGRPKFHEIKLKVNRPDLHIRTRSGFYGVTDDEVIQRAPLVAMPSY